MAQRLMTSELCPTPSRKAPQHSSVGKGRQREMSLLLPEMGGDRRVTLMEIWEGAGTRTHR